MVHPDAGYGYHRAFVASAAFARLLPLEADAKVRVLASCFRSRVSSGEMEVAGCTCIEEPGLCARKTEDLQIPSRPGLTREQRPQKPQSGSLIRSRRIKWRYRRVYRFHCVPLNFFRGGSQLSVVRLSLESF